MPVSAKISQAAWPRIAIFAESSDKLALRLAKAMRNAGAHVCVVSLKSCGLAAGGLLGLRIPGFEDAPPDGAFVRSVPAGSFEQVTMRLGVLHALRELGVTVWNDARAIECCVDKSMATHLFIKAGLAVPDTYTAQSREEAAAIVSCECTAEGSAFVLKPLFGSQGRGLLLVHKPDDLPPEEENGGLYYLQRFVEPANEGGWQDYRLFVVGAEVIAGIKRVGQGWITNVKQGATPYPAPLTHELSETALRAARAVGADYAGVDLIRGRCGTLFTLEVNSSPAWSGLEAANPGVNVAGVLAERFLDAVARMVASSGRKARMRSRSRISAL
ncbi:MAG: RimK family alpha-L-glutamate ligase [Alphaproteobacteria bacterium]